jgi:hypothetical protein
MIIAVMDRKYINNKKINDNHDDSNVLSNFEESLFLYDEYSTNDETSFKNINRNFDYSQFNIELNFEVEDIDIQNDKKRYESDDKEEMNLDWNSVFSATNENLMLGSNNFDNINNSIVDDDSLYSSSFYDDTQNTSNLKNNNSNNTLNNLYKSSFEDSNENIDETKEMMDYKYNINLSSNKIIIQQDNSNEINYSNDKEEKVMEISDSFNFSNKQLSSDNGTIFNNLSFKSNDSKRSIHKIFLEDEN